MIKSSTLDELRFEKNKYPYLGLYSEEKDFIVLFTNKSEGVVVWSNSKEFDVGYSSEWEEDVFEHYNGAIVLKND